MVLVSSPVSINLHFSDLMIAQVVERLVQIVLNINIVLGVDYFHLYCHIETCGLVSYKSFEN